MKVREFLQEEWEENSGRIIKKAILDKISHIVGSYQSYNDVDGPQMAVYEYWDHNIDGYSVSENTKWHGIEIQPSSDRIGHVLKIFGRQTIRLIVPMWIMDLPAKSEDHAKNLFRRNLKIVNQ